MNLSITNWIDDFISDNYALYENGGNTVLTIVFIAFGIAFLVPGIIFFIRNKPRKLASMKKHSAFANACIAASSENPSKKRPLFSNESSRAESRRKKNSDSLSVFLKKEDNIPHKITPEFYFEFNDDYEISLQ